MTVNLSAFVAPESRLRLTYGFVVPLLTPGARAEFANQLNDHWYTKRTGAAVVISPATAPQDGGFSLFGGGATGTRIFTSVDVKTAVALSTMTYDQFLAPSRKVYRDALHLLNAYELESVDLIAPAGTPAGSSAQQPTQRTQVVQRTAASDAASNPPLDLSKLFSTASKRLLFGLALVAVILLAWFFGPQLAALSRPSKE